MFNKIKKINLKNVSKVMFVFGFMLVGLFAFTNVSKATTGPVITINSYTTTPTSNDVTVTASVVNGTLITSSHTFTENGSFDFVAQDSSNNVTTKQVVITNIDKSGKVLGASAFRFTKLLKFGSSGNEVMELQKYLNTAGYNVGTPNGLFGPKTKAAVIKFQIANGLKGDGIVGSLARTILNK